MAQKSKSRVTAPRSYDPGKGRPKEYLAYLNYQEMQALKRLNGNNQERGPKGLPSFPPAGAMSGGSAKSPASTSTAKAAGSKPSTSSKMGSSSTQTGGVSKPSGGFSQSQFGGGGNKGSVTGSRTGGGGIGGNVTGARTGGGGAAPRGPGGSMAAAKASASKPAARGPAASVAAAKNTAKAANTPAFRSDAAKGGAIGNISKDKSTGLTSLPGGQIKGAIAAVKSGMTPTGYAQQNLRGPLGPNAEMRKGITPATDTYRLGQVSQNLYNKFGNRSIQEASRFMNNYARSLPAEAAVNMTRNFNDQSQRMRDLGRVGINQALNVSTDKVMRGIDTYNRPEFQNPSDRSMGLVSEDSAWASRARDALSDAMTRPATVSEVARNATNFTAPGTSLSKISRDIKKTGQTRAGNFGVDPAYSKRTIAANAEAANRLAGAPATPTPAVNRAGTPVAEAPRPRARPENQNMQRPTGPYAVAGNTVQPAAAALMRTEKLYNDRVPAETSRPMTTQQVERQYASMTDPTALPVRDVSRPMTTDQVVRQYARMGDPTQRPAPYAGPKVATKQIQDRVNVLPNNEQSLYTGRPTTVPRNEQSLYTGRPTVVPSSEQSLYNGRMTGGMSFTGVPGTTLTPSYPRSEYSGYGATGITTLPGVPKPDSVGMLTRAADAPPYAYSEKILGVENLMSDAGIRKPVNPVEQSYDPLKSVSAPKAPVRPGYASPLTPDPMTNALISGAVNLYKNMGPLPGVSVPRLSPEAAEGLRQWGVVKGTEEVRSLKDLALKAVPESVADAKFAEAASPVVKSMYNNLTSGIASLQENYRNAVADAQRVSPSIKDADSEDVSRGIKTVEQAENYKLGEGKVPSPQTAMPQTKQFYDRVPAETPDAPITRGPAASMAAANAIGKIASETQVTVPLRGEDGALVSGRATIDSYVDSYPGLDSEEKVALRNSMVKDVVSGNPDFTKADIEQKVSEIRNSASVVTDSEAADPAFANSLIGDDAYNAAKDTGYFQGDVLYNETFLNDPTQLGMLRAPVDEISPTDMAKIVNRSRALRYDDVKPYLTPDEKIRRGVSGVVERIVGFGAPSRIATGVAKKLMGIESPEAFLARPTYEQRALYQYAKAAEARREGRPVPDAGYPQGAPGDGFDGAGGYGSFGGLPDGIGRGGPGRIDGGSLGIGGIQSGSGEGDGEEGDGSASKAASGPRPQIYFEWDLGINIPSPGDSDYTMYMSYLAERQADAAAMYG